MSIQSLNKRKEELVEAIRSLGVFRRGSVAEKYRKCGKVRCHCAKKGDPGHGPQFLWYTNRDGHSYARNLRTEEEVSKYRRESERFREFVGICEELIEVNEKLCDLIPAKAEEETQADRKKKRWKSVRKSWRKSSRK